LLRLAVVDSGESMKKTIQTVRAGQIPLDPASGEVIGKDIDEQTRQVMHNLEAILKEAGSGFDRVVKTTVFLARMEDFPRFNQIYGEFLGDAKPARVTVEVSRLPKNVLIEVDAIAEAGP
jgi:2-iminobutanoate/2-iminopropanoate deaminase